MLHRSADPTETLFEADYESGDDYSGHKAPDAFMSVAEAEPDRVQALKDYAREGEYSVRHQLRFGDITDVGTRAESAIMRWNGDTPSDPVVMGETRYYGFSFLMDPTNHADDYTPETIWQMKPSESGNNFNLWSDDGGISFAVTTPGQAKFRSEMLFKYEKGIWYDAVFSILPSIDNDGWMQLHIRRQGEAEYKLMFEQMDAPSILKHHYAYVKWGMYKGTWIGGMSGTDVRTIWHDSIRVGSTFDGAIPIDDKTGTEKADLLVGTVHANKLFGLAGNDTLDGSEGQDLLDGGAGSDLASYEQATSGVLANLLDSTLNTGDAAGDRYVDVEGLVGSAFDDTLTGDAAANRIVGNAGNDTITGGTGNDVLSGGDGADHFLFARKDGKDTIVDFQEGVDDIILARTMFGQGMTARKLIQKFADRQGDDLVLKLGGGTTIIIKDGFEDQFQARDLLLV